MNSILITNAMIYTLSQAPFKGWLLTKGKTILNFGRGAASAEVQNQAEKTIDAAGKTLLPGFIDVHTHGCLGHCTMDADPETIEQMGRRYARHGVTSFIPTTMTGSQERIIKAIQAVTSLVGKRGDFAKILGTHLEGPFFNVKKCGAQDPANIRLGSREEALAYLDAGVIKLIAIAPEFPENLAAADVFAAHGVTISAGHTAASYEDLCVALDHGFSEITHLFNGMGAFNHREPGTIGGALALPEYACEMICDNVHSHPGAQKLAWEAKGNQHIILITDSIRPAGLADGTYQNEDTGETFIVSINGTNLRLPNGALAGSALTMERALQNFTLNSGATLAETWRCSSYNAALNIGIANETGSIEKNKLADLVLLDADFHAALTMIEGSIVYTEE